MSEAPSDRFIGALAGGTPRERAVAAAGLLAEEGAARLVLRSGGQETVLHARVTDLPGLMERAGRGELVAPSLGVSLDFDESRAVWRPLRGQ